MSAERAEQLDVEPWVTSAVLLLPAVNPMRWGLVPYSRFQSSKRAGLSQDDIDLWELNEAFASQCVYCRDFSISIMPSTT